MAKQKFTEVYDSSKTSKEAFDALLLEDLKKFKAPNGNNCPWKHGQLVRFDRFVPMTIENDRGTFYYLALGFVDIANRFAIQSCTKVGRGYKTGEISKDETFLTFESEGGMHDICDGVTEYDKDFLEKLYNWLIDCDLYISLKPYFEPNSFGGRTQKTLMNIVKINPKEDKKEE